MTKHIRWIFIFASIVMVSLAFHPIVAQSTIVFNEEFKDNTAGWDSLTHKTSDYTISAGKLDFALHDITPPYNENIISPAVKLPADAEVEVTGQLTTPIPTTPSYAGFGISFRGNDRNFAQKYEFAVFTDKSWNLSNFTQGQYTNIQDGVDKDVDFNTPVKLKVIAQSNRFTLFINDTRITTVFDTTKKLTANNSNYAGIALEGSNDTSFLKISFTEFQVSKTSSLPTPTTTSTATQKPKQSPTPAPTVIMFPNPFTDSNTWKLSSDQGATLQVTNDTLSVQLTNPPAIEWIASTAATPPDLDATVTCKVTEANTNDDWLCGIAFRGTNADNPMYYCFRVESTGQWSFQVRQGTDLIIEIIPGQKISGFNPKSAMKLQVIAIGTHFVFYFNSKKVGEIDDDRLPSSADNSKFFLYTRLVSTDPKAANKALFTFTDLNILQPAQ